MVDDTDLAEEVDVEEPSAGAPAEEEPTSDLEPEEKDQLKRPRDAERRIKKLIADREQERRERALERRRFEEEIRARDSELQRWRSTSYDAEEQTLQERLKLAQHAFRNAYQDGDVEKITQANDELAEIRANLALYRMRPKQQQQPAPEPAPQLGSQQLAPLAEEWVERHGAKGWTQEEIQVLDTVDHLVARDGYMPNTRAYYDEVTRRLSPLLPHRFSQDKGVAGSRRGVSAVSGPSREPVPNRQKVVLTSNDYQEHARFGTDLNDEEAKRMLVQMRANNGRVDYDRFRKGSK